MFDLESSKFYLALFNTLSVVALGIWTYLRTKDNDNAKAVTKVAEELAEFIDASRKANESQNLRLNTLAEQVRHMPTAIEVAAMRSGLEAVKEKVNGISHQTNLIYDHLLNNK
jgi:hypothetical protein